MIVASKEETAPLPKGMKRNELNGLKVLPNHVYES